MSEQRASEDYRLDTREWLRFDGTNLGLVEDLFDFVIWLEPMIMPSDTGHDWFYVQLMYKSNIYYAWMRSFQQNRVHMPCIIDEVKPVFNLRKIGTHYFRAKQKLFICPEKGPVFKNEITAYVLFKAPYTKDVDDSVIFETPQPLADIPIKPGLPEEIQRIVLFRELLGINHVGIESLIYVVEKIYNLDLSFAANMSNPKTVNPQQDQAIFPRLLDRLDVLSSMLQVEDPSELDDRLAIIGQRIRVIFDDTKCVFTHYNNIWMQNIRSKFNTYNHLNATYLD